ncbi:molybdate ABC transporter substrate-binding protein [Fodinibacter luteus]|uniref:Molybdate ABC transporter substrate-binding protein n=1 Tax=Fodinibacter luteus TaxID=552064 RepID=A0ABP8JXD8_9MICO
MRCPDAVPLALVALLLGACGASVDGPAAPTAAGTAGAGTASSRVDGEVTVLAAASLAAPLTSLVRAYETEHPGTSVRLGFGSSTTLAQQVAQGAPADLLATAGTDALDRLGDAAPTETTTIARNTLEIATPRDDPAGIDGLVDLAREDAAVVLCAATVPCGAAADEVLARAGVAAHVVSREIDVGATLAKVALGEADAAIVYHSDVVSAGGAVRGVEIPAEQNTTLDYPLARFGDDPGARDFAAYLAGPAGRAALAAAGFLPP